MADGGSGDGTGRQPLRVSLSRRAFPPRDPPRPDVRPPPGRRCMPEHDRTEADRAAWAARPHLPAPGDLLAGLLGSIARPPRRPFRHADLLAGLAETHGVPAADVDRKWPPGRDGVSLRGRLDAALGVLRRQNALMTDYDGLRITPRGRALLAAAGEAALRDGVPRAAAPSPPAVTDSAPVDPVAATARMIADLRRMPLARLHAMWVNALAALSGPEGPRTAGARVLLRAVALERARRGPAGDREEGDQPFRWPSTEAARGHGGLAVEAPPDGVLAAAGYHVGRTRGEPPGLRRAILGRLFTGALPSAPGVDAVAWGRPGTSARLRKLAHTLAALARNGKRRDADMEAAVADWEADLAWLKVQFYDGRHGFAWPDSG